MHDKAASHVEWLKREYYLSQKAYYNDAEYNKSVEKLISSGEQRLRERNLLPPVHAIRKGKSQTIKFTAVPLLKTPIKSQRQIFRRLMDDCDTLSNDNNASGC